MRILEKIPFTGGKVYCGPGDILYVSIKGKRVISAEIEEYQVFDTAIVVDDLEHEDMKETRGYFIGEDAS
jgi:hypothetical protein